MLVLTRKAGQKIQIGEAIVEILTTGRNRVKLSVDAPPHVKIMREEIRDRQEPNQETAPE